MTVVEIILLVLIILGVAAALLFFLRGLLVRSSQTSQPYGVARQETRHDMQVNFLRGGFLLVLALILLGVYGLTPGQEPATVRATASVPAESGGPTETDSPAETMDTPPTATTIPATAPVATIEATAVVLTATLAPTATATSAATITPAANTAVVDSPNGLWLREAPGGTQQLELIAHESTLTLMPGRETADDLEWQQVRTLAGNEGWVAADFLIYQN